MHSDRYEEAKRVVQEHEQACLDEFKQKLKALCDEYANVPRARELAYTISDHAGLGRMSREESHRAIAEGLLLHAQRR